MDARRIDRILRNLVLNALEHGEGKPVNIFVAADDTAVAVAVRDYGIGMSPAEAARVFDRFWRADPARARTTGGSGLGLSIAMEDTRLHDGWLEAWGKKGNGSNFRLTLPLRQGDEHHQVTRSSWSRPTSASPAPDASAPCWCWSRRPGTHAGRPAAADARQTARGMSPRPPHP